MKCLGTSGFGIKKRISNPLMARKMPLKQHENVCVFYKYLPKYNPIMQRKSTTPMTQRGAKIYKTDSVGAVNFEFVENHNELGYPKSIIDHIQVINNLTKDKIGLHPTQKPVALFEYLIKTYTDEGDLVLDSCSGSGTTAIACLNTNRKFICMEKEREYWEKSVERITKEAKRHVANMELFERAG